MDINKLHEEHTERTISALKVVANGRSMKREDSRTLKAITTGLPHQPSYCINCTVNTFNLTPHATMQDFTQTLRNENVTLSENIGLNQLLSILCDNIFTDDFYGLIASMGDEFVNISHPYILEHYLSMELEELIDPDDPIFDSIVIVRYITPPSLEVNMLSRLRDVEQGIYELISTSNSSKYALKVDFRNNQSIVEIKESYGDTHNFSVIVPIQTCRFEHTHYPYYGVHLVNISESSPIGTVIWPIHSPNIDSYASREVCTGQQIKVVPAISAVQGANFNSGYNPALTSGTLNTGYQEAIHVMTCRSRELVTQIFGGDYTNPLPELQVVENEYIEIKALKNLVREITGGFSFSTSVWESASTSEGVSQLISTNIEGDVAILLICSIILFKMVI